MATNQKYEEFRVINLPTTDLIAGNKYYLNVGGGKYQTYIVSDNLQLTKESGADFMEKDTVAQLRSISSREIWALQNGYYKGVKLNGYYSKGDTPAPIEYYISATTDPDDGGSVIQVGSIKLFHDFKKRINPKYFGIMPDGRDNTILFKQLLSKYKTNVYINFSAGVYEFDGVSVDGANNIVIIGEGVGTTIFKAKGLVSDAPFSFVNSTNSRIIGISIDGSGDTMIPPTAGDGANSFTITYCNKVTAYQCEFLNAQNKLVTTPGIVDCEFNECSFVSNGVTTQNQDLIQLYGGVVTCSNNRILNCHFYNPIRSAIYLETDVRDTTIKGNTFYNDLGFSGATAITGQVFGDGIDVDSNYFKDFKIPILLRCGYKNAFIRNNTAENISNSFISIQGQQAVFTLVKGEPKFAEISETISIGGENYYYLIKNIDIYNNTVTFSTSLLESTTSAFLSISGLATDKSYFDNIIIRENLVKSNNGLHPRFISLGIQNSISMLNTLTISDNTLDQSYNQLIGTITKKADNIYFTNNRVKDLLYSQDVSANNYIEFKKNRFINFNKSGLASGNGLGAIQAKLARIEENSFTGDGTISFINNPTPSDVDSVSEYIVNSNIDQNGMPLTIYTGVANHKIPLHRISRYGSNKTYFWLDSLGINRSSTTLPTTFFSGEPDGYKNRTIIINNNSPTPDLTGHPLAYINNSVTTNITNILSNSNRVTLVFGNSNTTLKQGVNINLLGNVDFVSSAFSTIVLEKSSTITNAWVEISRKTNATTTTKGLVNQAISQTNISQADLTTINTADATDEATAITLVNAIKAFLNSNAIPLINATKTSQNTELTNQRTAGQQQI